MEGTSWDSMANEHTWKVIDSIQEIAKKNNTTPSQVALNWLRLKSIKTSVIPIVGASKFSHLENMNCYLWNLSKEDEKTLDQVSQIKLPYPYNFQKKFGNLTL